MQTCVHPCQLSTLAYSRCLSSCMQMAPSVSRLGTEALLLLLAAARGAKGLISRHPTCREDGPLILARCCSFRSAASASTMMPAPFTTEQPCTSHGPLNRSCELLSLPVMPRVGRFSCLGATVRPLGATHSNPPVRTQTWRQRGPGRAGVHGLSPVTTHPEMHIIARGVASQALADSFVQVGGEAAGWKGGCTRSAAREGTWVVHQEVGGIAAHAMARLQVWSTPWALASHGGIGWVGG
jgi:hypothetical protein